MTRALDKTRAVEQAAEVLLVQFEAGDRLHETLQVQQREPVRREFEHDRAILDLGAGLPSKRVLSRAASGARPASYSNS